jgi:hypothetical protein
MYVPLLLLLLLLQALASQAQPGPGGVGRQLVEELPGLDGKALQEAAVSLLAQLGDPAAVLLASRGEGDAAGKVSFVAAISPQVSSSNRWQQPAAGGSSSKQHVEVQGGRVMWELGMGGLSGAGWGSASILLLLNLDDHCQAAQRISVSCHHRMFISQSKATRSTYDSRLTLHAVCCRRWSRAGCRQASWWGQWPRCVEGAEVASLAWHRPAARTCHSCHRRCSWLGRQSWQQPSENLVASHG